MSVDPRQTSSLPAKLSPVKRSVAAALAALALVCAGAVASAAPASPCKARTYRVHAGDTLFSIAQRFGTTVHAIVRANGLDARGILRIGVRLRVPGGCADARAAAVAAPAPAAELSASARTRAL